MKINADKCHWLVSKNNTPKIKSFFDITNSKSEKLLGVKFDHKLSFNDHISEICKKATRKIHALPRAAPYVNISKIQFSYCLLVWMCHSLANNGKINRIHERCL